MYVCLCYAVSEKQVKKVISEGATTLEEIQCKSRAGKNCGACICALEEMVERELGEKKDAKLADSDLDTAT